MKFTSIGLPDRPRYFDDDALGFLFIATNVLESLVIFEGWRQRSL
jgi:hypothetical protein